MGRIFSGVQPTGNLHLGNYLGAIRNWVGLQDTHESIYCIVDLHAITAPQDPKALYNSTLETAAAFIACGIDPKKSIIFPQSMVSAHTELNWLLECHTPLGWLNRMTQFKEKAGKKRDNAVLGLYGYPVLMAADVLAYQATHVPVGDDQKQHIELMRDIAGAFNRAYNSEFFPLPEPVIMDTAARIMSLRDGTKKMSKSDESEYSRINMTDDADAIATKFRKAKSDAIEGLSYDVEARPEASNLIQIFAALSQQPIAKVVEQYANSNFALFKKDLADLAVEKISPISTEMRRLMADEAALIGLLRDGADKADAIAAPILAEAKHMIGFVKRA